jgi:hypothetical protein
MRENHWHSTTYTRQSRLSRVVQLVGLLSVTARRNRAVMRAAERNRMRARQGRLPRAGRRQRRSIDRLVGDLTPPNRKSRPPKRPVSWKGGLTPDSCGRATGAATTNLAQTLPICP